MLFKTSTVLQGFANFSGEINFASLANTLQVTEETYLITVIGQAQYDQLNNAYNATAGEPTLSAPLTKLLYKSRRIVAPMLVYLWAPRVELKLNDAGLQRLETPTNKTGFQYQVSNFREAAQSEGEAATETMLAFINANAVDYPLWVADNASNDYNSFFIKDAKTFQKNFHTHSPHRIYNSMRFKMFDVEELGIQPAITAPVYAALKAKMLTNVAFTTAENALVKMLQKAIAYFTVAEAIPFLRVRIDGNGLTVMSQKPGGANEKVNDRTAAGDTAVSHMIRNSNNSGTIWLKSAFDYIVANAVSFPAYVVPVVISVPKCNETSCGSYGLC